MIVSFNCIFVIGPTAVGKTAVGVRIAHSFNGEILSADSRQVYKGLDIGSGKDLCEYNYQGKQIPYHIIDVTDLSHEYSLFDFQKDFYSAFSDCIARKKLPVCVGGTGMYVDSILRNYDMIEIPENTEMENELLTKSYDELKSILISEKEKLHNTSEFRDKERIVKAIVINRFRKTKEYRKLKEEFERNKPEVRPFVIGTTLERSLVRERISKRLKARLEEGLIEEVEGLHENGASFERLESLGLEYRFVSEYLQGKIASKDELYTLLNLAIGQFAKRQETWFRGMEKKGVKIHWLPEIMDAEERAEKAIELCREALDK
ncbi:MAG: tRNA (adenosine(37)-N6)-dimethylallyltransferase MiaA [Treponema sp.]|nr:tRNA (adenosine(37)-N6)-dimethylallyltransferase MiaA [Treponema sp.]